MREHDQSRLRHRLVACLGFLLALSALQGPRAEAGEAPGTHGAGDPIQLSARRVIVWDGPEGRWVVLSGDAAVLRGVEGLRARGAVVRIVEVNAEGHRGFQAEVYAEGDVRFTGGKDAPRAEYRGSLVTHKEVRLSPYEPKGLTELKQAPRGLPILHRSGFTLVEPEGKPVSPGQTRGPTTGPAENSQPRKVQATAATVQASTSLPTLERVPGSEAARVAIETSTRVRDPDVRQAQLTGGGRAAQDEPRRDPGRPTRPAAEPANAAPAGAGGEPPVDLPPIEGAQEVEVPNLNNPEDLPRAAPLPGDDDLAPAPPMRRAAPEAEGAAPPPAATRAPRAPILPGTQRVTSIFPRSGRAVDVQILAPAADGTRIVIYRGGVNVVSRTPQFGVMDIEAESAVIWRHPDPKQGEPKTGPNGEVIENANQPMEIYLEGNVVVRQDENKFAGKADQRTYRAQRAYYDFLSDRFVALDGEADLFAPGLISPMKIKSPRIDQFHPLIQRADGSLILDPNPEIRAEQTISSGSRFPNPAYRFTNRSIDLTRTSRAAKDPNSGRLIGDRDLPTDPQELVWRYDSRQNIFYMGRLPVFYWPRFSGEIDDLEPPLRQIGFRSNNYFGQQVLTDWNGFKLFNLRRPESIDQWNIDLDYLSARTKSFPALGSELGWFGRDLMRDLTDPYHRNPDPGQSLTHDYFGFFDIWGLKDEGLDVLGSGPAVVTNGPPGAGKRGYQRSSVPAFQDIRGRFNIRHMQRFLADDEEHRFEDLRLQLEAAYVSDRHFIEEYYKRLNDTGMDQETLGYVFRQKDNWAWSVWAEANLQDFYTDTQWLPRFDYYRLGDSFLSNWVTYYQHSGVNYANTHTDIMVDNPNIFAFMPYDPISNTANVFRAGRAYTSHEIDVPINIADVVRIVPYAQGQAVGWSDQLGGGTFHQQPTGAQGRLWGAVGAHAEMTAWKVYPNAESEILNVHGLNNKISFYGDFRAAFSNQSLNQIAVQDDLDDNTYEFVRRYFALTNWTGGILPTPYDPRFLILRRQVSPITGTTDIQSTLSTATLGIHQRLQTKRGREGQRRIVDWMTLDLSSTYFPNAKRDNFGTPWGQTMYNWQWFVGDRTSIVSSGWFEYFDLVGSKPLVNYNVAGFNPTGVNVITTGVSLSRPPRANLFMGYSVINTGTINTSALNASLSYWLSPKWYGTYSTSYDFGNKILLGSMFSITRIGADYLTSIGLSVDPQRQSYMFAFQISPRLSPSLRLGSGVGLNQFDSRYAPTQ